MGELTLPEVRDRFDAYHRKHPSWGSLHIVLDDDNVKDDDVRFCLRLAEEHDDAEGAVLARILLRLSKTQRLKLGRRR